MSNDNNVTINGNATRDPELRFTAAGQALCNFGVAANRKWQNRQTQEWEEQVSFFDVTCWGMLAENVAESVTKGMRVIVVGRLDQRSWETQDGDKRSKVEIVASTVGPDLQWATAQVTKNPRQNDGQADRQPNQNVAPSQRRAAPAATGPSGYAEEEPF